MVNRARFLHAAGYAVLLIDLQAAGESPGKAVTLGYREANDVKHRFDISINSCRGSMWESSVPPWVVPQPFLPSLM